MMMQMLDAGGLECFTDGERTADDSNPRGYYEHEAVKSLGKNARFLKEAEGKVVKIIAQLLPKLPPRYRYRIVFMERDLMEVVQSQQRMLVRDGKRRDADTLPMNLLEQYRKTLDAVEKWAESQPHVEILRVPYREAIAAPFVQAMRVNDFFEGKLAVERMAQAVDGKLYREVGK